MTLSCSTQFDLNIDDFFDFDAASCDSSATNDWEPPQTQKTGSASSPHAFDDSVLERLMFERDTHQDTHQIKVDFTGIYATTDHDMKLGLPPALEHEFWESPEVSDSSVSDSSDSDSSWSAPGSPSSSRSALSPPRSPISWLADNAEDDVGLSSNLDVFASSVEISTNFYETRRDPIPSPSTTAPSLATHLRAPDSERLPLECSREPVPLGSSTTPLSPAAAIISPSVHHVGDHLKPGDPPLSRSSSPDSPDHRTGKKPKKLPVKKPRVPCRICNETFTREADLKRHRRKKHEYKSPAMIFSETGKERQWCMGCFEILSREDARRRHEETCRAFADYVDSGYVRDPTRLPLPEIYGETNPEYRLWCLQCYGTFSHPGERHAHEQGCTGESSCERGRARS
ncbi:hypothetical protein B0H15DRAFT_447189 [Mycena belliarum]|uniref:C2H2-type domain-containing protein n=1 Tax=Mycena belliarum TaxID=1033014 RepID=A0AAD6XR36_9AGAR|nr:hypothetical protein B0H15DRAFT_447189 [Mycena belliae]